MESFHLEERIGDDVNNTDCRTEVYRLMFELIGKLESRGWSEVEITIALADAADEHVMVLAKSRRQPAH